MDRGTGGSTRCSPGRTARTAGGVQGPRLPQFHPALRPSGGCSLFSKQCIPAALLSRCIFRFCRKSYTLPGGVSSPSDGSPRELQEFQTFGDASAHHQVSAGPPEICGDPEPEYLPLKQLPASERPRPSSLFVSKRAFLRGVFQPSPTVPGSLPTTPSDLRTGPPGNSRSRLVIH